ncbi:UPF0193 protein EVG1 [Orussus abietinus]|uniref:UPF0193 protein EVG1 n=1 Tax=Orussus abietinus TaxID=222816 RepID=UPI000626ADA1|nr:UPF0193 protein EVG1 [Orussus abietinus]
MERNYQRVGVGVGAFHNPPRAKYSEETRNLIKVLMEESRLSMMQRKFIQDAVDRGEPLPPPAEPKPAKPKYAESKASYPCLWKKRMQEAIVSSGAYEREQYRRLAPLPNKEKQKRHLACMMAYGKDMPLTPQGPRILHKARRQPQIPENVDALQDLVDGIRERMEFLTDMENLGQGKKYRPIIQQEIAQKIRLMEAIDKEKSKEVRREMGGFERPCIKTCPLGELDDP